MGTGSIINDFVLAGPRGRFQVIRRRSHHILLCSRFKKCTDIGMEKSWGHDGGGANAAAQGQSRSPPRALVVKVIIPELKIGDS